MVEFQIVDACGNWVEIRTNKRSMTIKALHYLEEEHGLIALAHTGYGFWTARVKEKKDG